MHEQSTTLWFIAQWNENNAYWWYMMHESKLNWNGSFIISKKLFLKIVVCSSSCFSELIWGLIILFYSSIILPFCGCCRGWATIRCSGCPIHSFIRLSFIRRLAIGFLLALGCLRRFISLGSRTFGHWRCCIWGSGSNDGGMRWLATSLGWVGCCRVFEEYSDQMRGHSSFQRILAIFSFRLSVLR